MKAKRILLLFLLNIGHLFLFYNDAVCMHIIDRRQQPFPFQQFPPGPDLTAIVPTPTNQIHHRQSPFLPNPLFSGPLTLAAFLFALPMIPSLVMAPFAMAGLPSAMTALTTMMSAMTHGKPLNTYLQPLIEPLTTLAASGGNSSSSNLNLNPFNQPIRRQLKLIKTFARTFRTAINKRYSVMQNANNPVQDIPVDQAPLTDTATLSEPDIEDLTAAASTAIAAAAAVANVASGATNSSTDPLALASALVEQQHSVPEQSQQQKLQQQPEEGGLNVAQMEKTIKGMDLLYNSIRDIYSVIRNGLRRYEITDSECQSRIVCEIHQKIISRNKLLKTFSLNALDILNLERHIDSWNSLNKKSKETIKFYINAAKIGFADKDCMKEFQNCPTLKRRSLRNIILRRSFYL